METLYYIAMGAAILLALITLCYNVYLCFKPLSPKKKSVSTPTKMYNRKGKQDDNQQ